MTDAVTPPSARACACRLTPAGEGGISLILLAGSSASAILDRLFHSPRGRRPSRLPAGGLLYGRLRRNGVELDEVIVECAAPEGRFIINCHGGPLAVGRVIEALAAEGASEVPWPELAAQDGTLDAVQREAAARLPGAPTLRGAQMLLTQYRGALSEALRRTADALAAGDLSQAHALLRALSGSAPWGRGLVEPLTLVVAGRPNAGKSTLVNALLRFERMIIHHEPGTTRDAVEELLAVDGVPFRLTDTAGIRETAHDVEREGVALSIEALRHADLALLLFDVSMPLGPDDLKLIAARPGRCIPVLSKCDLPAAHSSEEIVVRLGVEPVRISAVTGAGLAALEARILAETCPNPPAPEAPVVFTKRQQECLGRARAALDAGHADVAVQAIGECLGCGAAQGDAARAVAYGPAPG